MAVLASLLSTHGVVPDAIASSRMPTRPIAAARLERLLRRLNSPETPPPAR